MRLSNRGYNLLDLKVKTQTGSFDIEACVMRIGEDLLVAIWGGDKPHIGAVAAALPRASLKDPAQVSATASVISFPAHKEHELVRRSSEKISAALNTAVVVTAGIHWDELSNEGISAVMKNSELLVDLILQKLEQVPEGEPYGS
jgi:hypothetical protein